MRFPRKDWGWAFRDFEMMQDFVKNTPWRSREEKTTIQAFHKLVWHPECPRNKVPFIYRILKVMKKNMSIYKLLGQNVKIMKNAGQDAPPPSFKMELALYVHWHTAYQMSTNHVALHGLVNPDKRVELFCLADGDVNAQESVITSVQEILTKHRVDHLCL